MKKQILEVNLHMSGKPKNEYDVLILKYKLLAKKTLGDCLRSLIVYGSYCKGVGYYIAGESDVDIVLVLTEQDNSERVQTLMKLSAINQKFASDPLFGPLFDLTIVGEEEIGKNHLWGPEFSSLHALSAQKGKLILGEDNPFEKCVIEEKTIKEAASRIILNSTRRLRYSLLNKTLMDENELVYQVTDSILSCGLAFTYFIGTGATENYVKTELPDIFKTALSSNISDPEIIEYAHGYRLGVQHINSQEMIQRGSEFCEASAKYILLNMD
ncbi:MAG: hypothetical protein ACFFCQ_09535 [Promethearchaeota archaeon]